MFDEEIDHNLPQFRGHEGAFPLHVGTVDQDIDRGSIGAGPSDSLFLQRPDKARIIETGRRLREMLARQKLVQAERLSSPNGRGPSHSFFLLPQ